MYYLFFGAWACFLVPIIWLKFLGGFLWLFAFIFSLIHLARKEFKDGFIGLVLAIIATPVFFMFGSFIQLMVSAKDAPVVYQDQSSPPSRIIQQNQNSSYLLPQTQNTIKPIQPSLLTKYPNQSESTSSSNTNNPKSESNIRIQPQSKAPLKPEQATKTNLNFSKTTAPTTDNDLNTQLPTKVSNLEMESTPKSIKNIQPLSQPTQYKLDTKDPKQLKAQENINDLKGIVLDQISSSPEKIPKKQSTPLPTININTSTDNAADNSITTDQNSSKEINSASPASTGTN